jgi:soluble lytic murein transglycosylase-like protein
MDLHFARSRRRAAARRREPAPRPKTRWRTIRIALLAAAIFGVVGGSASLEISDAGPAAAKAKSPLRSSCPVPAQFRHAFANAAAKTHIPLSLLVAMAYEESRFNPAARSHAGAQGLFQLMPGTAKALALSETVPESNVLGGARYLREMLRRFGSLDLALSAYNAGPTAVAKAGAAPSLETLRYVKNVEARASVLQAAC